MMSIVRKNQLTSQRNAATDGVKKDRLKLHFKVYHFAAISLVLKPLYTHCPPT